MMIDLYLTALLHSIGLTLFGVFEERTPRRKRLLKLVLINAITALLVFTVGRPWSLIWVLGSFALATSFHVGWALKNHIHPLTAEPRERYYQLRGWPSET